MSELWCETELELRARRYGQLRAAWSTDPERRDVPQVLRAREDAVEDLRALLTEFLAGRASLASVRELVERLSTEHPILGFEGPVGMVVLDQLADDGEPGVVDEALRAAWSLPADHDAAAHQIDALAAYVEHLRSGGSALEARRLPYFVSWFWMVQDGRWRPIWPSGEGVFSRLAWLPSRSAPVALRYRSYVALRAAISARSGSTSSVLPEIEFDEIGGWLYYVERAIGMDETLVDRCARARTLRREPGTGPGAEVEYDEALTNVRVMQAEANRLGRVLNDVVAARLGMDVEPGTPPEFVIAGRSPLRADACVSWRVPGADDDAPSLRLWITADGPFVVLAPGGAGSFVLGAKLDAERAVTFDTLAADVGDAVAELAPAFSSALAR